MTSLQKESSLFPVIWRNVAVQLHRSNLYYDPAIRKTMSSVTQLSKGVRECTLSVLWWEMVLKHPFHLHTLLPQLQTELGVRCARSVRHLHVDFIFQYTAQHIDALLRETTGLRRFSLATSHVQLVWESAPPQVPNALARIVYIEDVNLINLAEYLTVDDVVRLFESLPNLRSFAIAGVRPHRQDPDLEGPRWTDIVHRKLQVLIIGQIPVEERINPRLSRPPKAELLHHLAHHFAFPALVHLSIDDAVESAVSFVNSVRRTLTRATLPTKLLTGAIEPMDRLRVLGLLGNVHTVAPAGPAFFSLPTSPSLTDIRLFRDVGRQDMHEAAECILLYLRHNPTPSTLTHVSLPVKNNRLIGHARNLFAAKQIFANLL